MTGWTIRPGYQSERDWPNVISDIQKLLSKPEDFEPPRGLEEILEAAKVDLSATWKGKNGERDHMEDGMILLLASGGGPDRKAKERHRRWIVRRLLESAHQRGFDLSVVCS